MHARPALRRLAFAPALTTAGLLLSTTLAGPAHAATAATTAGATPAPAAAASAPGLFGAQDPTYDGVYRQSLAILGLLAAGSTPDAEAVSWLAAQQCANGGFTAYRADVSVPCAAGGEDENATAMAVQALAALGKPTSAAIGALKHFQLADGGFYDNTAFGAPASDANSTGLALSAFAAAGVDPASVTSTGGKTGADYLRSLQLDCAAASGAGGYDFQSEATLTANDYATVQATLGMLGKALPVAAATPSAAVPGCTTPTDAAASAQDAIGYLAARLTATAGAIPSGFGSGTDWTSTANAVVDLTAAGEGADAAHAGLVALQANVAPYAKSGGAYVAGPLAMLLLVAHATGTDAHAFGGVDLVAALTGIERAAAPVTPSPTASPTPAPRTTGTSGGTLPMTGVRAVPATAGVATLLLVAGAACVLGSRRRRGTDAAR
jgi:hypothetical protein